MMAQRWAEDFAAFHADMGDCPPGLTLERINNARGYEPGNCRWASRKEQDRNKRSNVRLTLNGETLCVSAWAERLGMSADVIHSRLRYGWSVERTLTTPARARRRAK